MKRTNFPLLTEAGVAVHWCPSLQLHNNGVSTLTYSGDRHRPPREAAITAIALSDKRATRAQWGHQRPPFTSPGAASHSCPATHFHRSFVSLLIYRSERHAPPRCTAKARISPSVSRFLCAHLGHQLPWVTLVGIALHACPNLHRHRSGVLESMYRLEMHFPYRSFARRRIC